MDTVKKYFDLAKKQALPMSLDEANKMIDDFNGFPKGGLNINIKKLIIMISSIISIALISLFVINQNKSDNTKEISLVKNEISFVEVDKTNDLNQENNPKKQTIVAVNKKQNKTIEEKKKPRVKNSYQIGGLADLINYKPIKNKYIPQQNKGIYDTIITKEFTTSQETGIYLESNHSNVEIKTWTEPKVKVIAKYIISGKAKNKRLFLDNINLNLFSKKDVIIGNNFYYYPSFFINSKVTLSNGERKTYKRKRIKKYEFENGVRSNIDSVHIDYIIFIPKDFNIDLSLTDGNIDIAKTNGEITISQQKGSLTIDENNNELYVELERITANIKSFNKGEFYIYHSDIKFNSAKSMSIIDFHKSNLEFNSCESLRIENSQKSKIKGLNIKKSLFLVAHKSIIKLDKTAGVSEIYSAHSHYQLGAIENLTFYGHKDSLAIKTIDKLNIQETEHSQFYIKKAGTINLESHKSTYAINTADSIIVVSDHGKLSVDNLNYLEINYTEKEKIIIHQLNTLKGTLRQSNLKIDLLQKNADFENYGGIINIGLANNKFEKIKLHIEKSELSIQKKEALKLAYKFHIYDARVNIYDFDLKLEENESSDDGYTIYKSKNFESTNSGKIDITSYKSNIKIGKNTIK